MGWQQQQQHRHDHCTMRADSHCMARCDLAVSSRPCTVSSAHQSLFPTILSSRVCNADEVVVGTGPAHPLTADRRCAVSGCRVRPAAPILARGLAMERVAILDKRSTDRMLKVVSCFLGLSLVPAPPGYPVLFLFFVFPPHLRRASQGNETRNTSGINILENTIHRVAMSSSLKLQRRVFLHASINL